VLQVYAQAAFIAQELNWTSPGVWSKLSCSRDIGVLNENAQYKSTHSSTPSSYTPSVNWPCAHSPASRHVDLLRANWLQTERTRSHSSLIPVRLMWIMIDHTVIHVFRIILPVRSTVRGVWNVKCRCKKDIRKYFFSHRVVSKWNMLDNDSEMAKTVNGFKTKLKRERAKNMGLFLDWCLLDLGAVTGFRSGRPASILQVNEV